ncbi:hypothetical protein BC835DRAFT_290091 [Cytidiella melzeri]|nr:hypothetical protein BC835DRAFT_290091 [Cytidiella melzeri]
MYIRTHIGHNESIVLAVRSPSSIFPIFDPLPLTLNVQFHSIAIMLFTATVPFLFLAASANAAAIPARRSAELQVRDLSDFLSGIASIAEGLLSDLPADIAAPLESFVAGLLDPTSSVDDDVGTLITSTADSALASATLASSVDLGTATLTDDTALPTATLASTDNLGTATATDDIDTALPTATLASTDDVGSATSTDDLPLPTSASSDDAGTAVATASDDSVTATDDSATATADAPEAAATTSTDDPADGGDGSDDPTDPTDPTTLVDVA